MIKRTVFVWLCILTLCFSNLTVSLYAQPRVASDVNLNLTAEAAILIDATTQTILYEKNAYTKEYPASITKLMTALLAIENLNRADVITFSDTAVNSIEFGSSHIGIKSGEQLTVDEALHGLLLMSANEVANGLAEQVSGSIEDFAAAMTARAKELGAENTHFVNPHGLHDVNHYTTAYDMSLIANELVKNDYFLQLMQDYTYEIQPTNITDEIRYLSQQHRMLNPLRAGNYYREDVIGGKTGYTDEARHTLVTMAQQGDSTIIAVVLKSEDIYSDTNVLLDYGFNNFHSVALHSPTETIKTLPIYAIKSGKSYQAGNCSVAVADSLSVIVPNDTTFHDLTTHLDLPEYIALGAEEGDVIGSITYSKDGHTLAASDLKILKISYLSSPTTTILPSKSEYPILKYAYIIGIVVAALLILWIIYLIYKKHRLRSNRIKMGKLFK